MTKQLEKKTHDGVVRYSYLDWRPRDLPEREGNGTVGLPVCTLQVFADRIEMRPAWCFTSGQAEMYEDGPMETVARGASSLLPRVSSRFGPEIAVEVEQLFADPSAFE